MRFSNIMENLNRALCAEASERAGYGIKVSHKDIEHLPNTRDLALLIIDAQAEHCAIAEGAGNKKTEEACEKIGKLAPIFRKAAIQIYAIHVTNKTTKPKTPGFYKWSPAPTDIIVEKFSDSAFKTGKTKTLLKKSGKNRLLVCGFNTNACVHQTVVHAIKNGYKVYVIKDLTENGRLDWSKKDGLESMRHVGAKIITSKQALKMAGVKA